MMCKHERLRAVGDQIFCKDCGAEVTDAFLASVNGGKPAEKQAPEAKTDKGTPKKRTAKKAV